MRITDTSDVWWKTAVVYCLDVEAYLDWNGDGVGDLAGLAHRLDYLNDLGVTCVWLMPFYPSPLRDDGYDISDFYGVHPRLGTHGDLVEMLRTASDRGMRVIADLIVNHSSHEHSWFQSARGSRESTHREWYVWRDEPPEQQPAPVFPDAETSVWTYDRRARQYYLHHFYKEEPDLNVEHEPVREELARIAGFWLELGFSGFRVDAVPFFVEADDGRHEARHEVLRNLSKFLQRRRGDAVLLGEVNLPYDQQLEYFGEAGNELTMQFDFVGMQKLYLSLARRDARPLVEALQSRPPLPDSCQWANFVRNHDELTLDKLSDEERQEVFTAFGPDPDMQLYGRGLRRRLPPMLGGDPRRLRMVYSLLFCLPGTPVLFYGEEIGMGEELSVPGRKAVRTTMQWSPDPHGGFTTADESQVATTSGGYGPQFVNVSEQRGDPDSLLSFITTLTHRYRQCPELGWGQFALLDQPHTAVLAHTLTWEDARMVALHNLGDEPHVVPVRLDDVPPGSRLVDLFDGQEHALEDGAVDVPLEGYGHQWLRVVHPHDRRLT